ncbi:extracellular calcium-sensing receptor-like [Gastrophryne carolinensis]
MWKFTLIHLILALYFHNNKCRLDINDLEGTTRTGDIMIGHILPLHLDKVYEQIDFTQRPPKTTCTMFHLENYQQFQALVFALDEINHNPNVLSNMTLGFQAYDTCSDLHLALKGSLQVITGNNAIIPNYRCMNNVPLSAIIGASVSTHSIAMAQILGLYRYPQVSHFSTSPLLSDRTQFPSFFRTVPSDTFQSKGLSELVLQFGWTWVGLLALDNIYGQQGILLVRKEIIKAGACVAFMENIQMDRPDRNAPRIVEVIKKSTAKVLIVFSDAINLLPILDEMLLQNVSDKVLVASEAWSTSSLFLEHSRLLSGTVGIALYSGSIPGFKDFLNKNHFSMEPQDHWIKNFWEETFNCKFLNNENTTNVCTGTEDLGNIHNSYNDVSSLRVTYNVYTAALVVFKALEDLIICNTAREQFSDRICANVRNFQPWQLLRYIKNVQVKLTNGRDLYFDENGDPPAVYDIINWQLTPEGSIRHIKIGSYEATANQSFLINSASVQWATRDQQVPHSFCSDSCPPGFRKTPIQGQPICCFHCVRCPQGEISNDTDSLHCSKCPWNQWPNSENSRCLMKIIEYLSYEDPLGAAQAFISIVSFLVPAGILRLFSLHKTTPIVKANNYFLSCLFLVSLSLCFLCSLAFIGYPNKESCLIRQAIFGMVFALCISCILAKTLIVMFAFMATKPDSKLSKWTKPQASYVIVFICCFLQFILCATWLSVRPPFSQYNLQEKPGVIVVQCNENSPAAFWIMLGYLFLLATFSFIVAFLTRRLPNTFNEAKLITFSMLAFLSVWVSFIPASLSSSGKYTVALEIFAIQSSTWALVICISFPKCFIIIWRPAMNSREYINGRRPKKMFLLENFQQFQTLKFAVEEINRNQDILPNVTLGFYAYDSCTLLYKELEGTLSMVTGSNKAIPNYTTLDIPHMAAVLGHSTSTYSILMAHILGLYRYPQDELLVLMLES